MDDLLDRIETLLSASPPLTAREIARRLDHDRSEVNRQLHLATHQFEKDESFKWTIRTTEVEIDRTIRPSGPFGPARSLLPDDQEFQAVDGGTPCRDVLRTMLDQDFSAIPVSVDGHIIGVATLESVHERLLSIGDDAGVKARDLLNTPIRSMCHKAQFVQADHYIDERIDWSDVQHVIVGTSTDPLGILTVSDVWQRLNRFAENFVLVHEIEIGLRSLIERIASRKGEDVSKWLGLLRQHQDARPASTLEDLVFSDYLVLMRQADRWAYFEPHLGPFESFRPTFNVVNGIRNSIVHFRSGSDEDVKILRQFRIEIHGWLRTIA